MFVNIIIDAAVIQDVTKGVYGFYIHVMVCCQLPTDAHRVRSSRQNPVVEGKQAA